MSGFFGDRLLESSVTKTLSANNTTANVNLFQFTGNLYVTKLYGVLTSKTTLTNMTGVYFSLYDSNAENVLTKNDGVMSTALPGALIVKTSGVTTTATINLATFGYQASVAFQSFFIQQKNGANTFVRFNYTTTDAPINAEMKFFIQYESLAGGALTVV